MAEVSIVKVAELKAAKRIDSDRYRIKFLDLENKLRAIPNVRKLKFLIVEPVRTGHTPRDRDIREDDRKIHFIKTDTLREGLIDFENSDFLPARSLSERDYVEPKDVIVTIIGAHFNVVGRAAIFFEHYPQSMVNQNIAVIKCDESTLSPYYLMVFLNCKYGRQQLWGLSRQTEQVNLNCREVEELLIPVFKQDFQREIERGAKEFSKLIEKSKLLYSKAEQLLMEELGLKDFHPIYELSYSTTLLKAFGNHCFTAEYFQPTYENLVRHLTELVRINFFRDFLLDIKKGVEVGAEQYQEEGKPFIRVSNLSVSGFIERDQKYVDETLYEELVEHYQPKFREMLLTKDATPGIAYVVKEPIEGIIASGILRLTVDETRINKEYLALCINSLIGKLQIERDGRGSVIKHWGPQQIKQLTIPVLPDHTQQKIELLVQQSHKEKKKAKALLEEAKRKVEVAIEQSCKVNYGKETHRGHRSREG